MRKLSKKNLIGYLSAVLALALIVVSSVALFQMNSSADAESVTVSENATVVTSPFTQAVEKVKDSVVGVNNYTTYNYNYNNYFYGYGFGNGFGNGNGNGRNNDDSDTNRQVLQGSGSGVVVAKGYVLTNFHVVDGSSMLEVTSGDKTYPAVVAASNEATDLAVLKVDDLDVAPVTLGDSDQLSVGDWAICIGNPLSFTGTTTVGVISALNREISNTTTDEYGLRTESKNKMIQTDAAINAGNSGGGMFNVAGELVGIPSMKYTGSYYSGSSVEGIGMAIPVNEAKDLINEAINNKDVPSATATSGADTETTSGLTTSSKPRIGVVVTNMNTSNYAVANGIVPNGAYVTEVEKNSPAEKAGLKVADIVVAVDDTVVDSSKQMVSLLQNKQVGDTVKLKVYRVEGGLDSVQDYESMPEGEYVELTVELALLDDAQS